MCTRLSGWACIGARVWPCACSVDQVSCAAPATRMGPPLTESTGRCRVDERRSNGGPHGGQQAVRCVLNACSKAGGNGARHRVPRLRFCLTRRASGAPSCIVWRWHWRQAGSGHCRGLARGQRLKGRWFHPFTTDARWAGNDCDASLLYSERVKGPSGNASGPRPQAPVKWHCRKRVEMPALGRGT